MTPTHDLTTEEIKALIYHYNRIRVRIADNITAMERLTDLQREYDVRVAVLNDETKS